MNTLKFTRGFRVAYRLRFLQRVALLFDSFLLRGSVEESLEQNLFKKTQRSRILRLPQPEHRLLAHFRIAVILRDLN
jgi:hypothetical protein